MTEPHELLDGILADRRLIQSYFEQAYQGTVNKEFTMLRMLTLLADMLAEVAKLTALTHQQEEE